MGVDDRAREDRECFTCGYCFFIGIALVAKLGDNLFGWLSGVSRRQFTNVFIFVRMLLEVLYFGDVVTTIMLSFGTCYWRILHQLERLGHSARR